MVEIIAVPVKARVPTEEELFPGLSDSEKERVRNCLRGSGTVVKGFNVEIQVHDLKTLSGTSWLNDEVTTRNWLIIGDKLLRGALYG